MAQAQAEAKAQAKARAKAQAKAQDEQELKIEQAPSLRLVKFKYQNFLYKQRPVGPPLKIFCSAVLLN
jgi:hypothetical protein